MTEEEPGEPYVPEPTQDIIDRILCEHVKTATAKSRAALWDRGEFVPAVRAFAKAWCKGDYEQAHQIIRNDSEPIETPRSYRESRDNPNRKE